MPDVSLVLIVLLVAWQVVVAVLLAVLFRQVTLISGAVGLLGPSRDSQSGLVVDNPIPPLLVGNRLLDRNRRSFVFWLSAGCATCSRLASELAQATREGTWEQPSLVLVTGPAKGAEALVASVEALGPVIRDPDASTIVDGFGLSESPFVVETMDGVITGWTTAQGLADVINLRDARSPDADVSMSIERKEQVRQGGDI